MGSGCGAGRLRRRVDCTGIGSHLTQVRFQPWFHGTDQVNSFMSAIDMFSQWYEERAFLSGCIGVYFFRIDVELKTKGMDLWPKDRVCFLWRTAAMGSETTVNDVLFYVPCGSLIAFRATVAECRDRHNLHWVSDVPAVSSVMWLEYDFNHPSDTQKSSNPRYKMSDRLEATGADHYGKFHEHKLRQREEYQSLHAAFLSRHDEVNDPSVGPQTL